MTGARIWAASYSLPACTWTADVLLLRDTEAVVRKPNEAWTDCSGKTVVKRGYLTGLRALPVTPDTSSQLSLSSSPATEALDSSPQSPMTVSLLRAFFHSLSGEIEPVHGPA